jgi:inner membrane protein
MISNSTHPSFEGNLSPLDYKIGVDGFNAQWQAQSNNSSQSLEKNIKVRFLNGVDDYLLIDRTIEYGIFVILCLFATILAFEMIQNRTIHTIQYILVGAAQILFYLLLLSLGEQIGFTLAYILGALLTIFMICSYIKAVLKSYKSAFILASILSLIYSFLFIVLKSADYSLLIGSFGLCTIIGVLMYVTRNIHEKEQILEAKQSQDL